MVDTTEKRLPDFLIVGSMKAGTTSLHHWLMQSEQISMKSSETHFFNRDYRYEKGIEEYKRLLPVSSHCSLVGDDTPGYSYLPEVPARIRSMVPEVKVLWILRDPLERAISHYWHAARHGNENLPIDQAFLSDINGNTKSIWRQYLYRSCYRVQIERFMEYFDRSQIHFVDFRSFINSDREEVNKVTNFLGINPIYSDVPHSNEARFYPRSSVNKALSSIPLPYQVKRVIRWSSGYRKELKPSISESTRDEAHAFLEKHNVGLVDLVGFFPA